MLVLHAVGGAALALVLHDAADQLVVLLQQPLQRLLVHLRLAPQPFRHERDPTAATMPSQMEHAMETLMFTFHKYAGDKNYLSKEDLRALMEKEFPGFLENQRDPMALDKIMKDLDQCRDGKVGFQSFFSLVAGLTIACNDYFVVHMKQKGRK